METRRASNHHRSGFSLIEILVSLVLVGVLGLVAGGFLLPMRLSGNASGESQALAYARSSLEIVKNRWLNPGNFQSMVYPSTTGANADIKLATGWTLSFDCKNVGVTPSVNCSGTDQLRTLTVKVKPLNRPEITLTTQLSRPSYE